MKRRISLLIIVFIILNTLGCNINRNDKNEVETMGMLNMVPPGGYIVANILEIDGNNKILVEIIRKSNCQFDVGDKVFVSFKEVNLWYDTYSEDEAQWDIIYDYEEIIDNDENLINYFSIINIGDKVMIDVYEDEANIEFNDDVATIYEDAIEKYIYDPHLDPIFRE